MFVLKKFPPKFQNDEPTLEWVIIPDGIVEEIWDEVISIYKSYLMDHASDVYDTVSTIPVEYVKSPEKLKRVVYDGYTVYLTSKTPRNFRMLTDSEYVSTLDSVRRVFTRNLNDRIQQIFDDRYGKYSHFNQIMTTPKVIENVAKIVKFHDPDKSILSYTFFRDCEKCTNDDLKVLKNAVRSIGFAFSNALKKRNGESYLDLINEITHTNRSKNLRISKWSYPPTISLYSNKPNVKMKAFRLAVYQDGYLVFEKKGRFINYAWIDMMDKLMKQVKHCNGGSWVFVAGILNVKE